MTDVNRIDAAGQAAPDPNPTPVDLDELAQEPPEPDDARAKPERPPQDIDLVFRHIPHFVAGVGIDRIFLFRENIGLWTEKLDVKSDVVMSTVRSLIRKARRAEGINGLGISIRDVTECAAGLTDAMSRAIPGVIYCDDEQLNAEPVLPLKGGGGIDLRGGRIFDPAELRRFMLTDWGKKRPGVDYRPELLTDQEPAFADAVLRHYIPGYGTEKSAPDIFRRVGRHLLGPDKTIDTVCIPTSNAGKSTLAEALEKAFPGIIKVASAPNLLTPQAMRFSSLEAMLILYRLVILDEADKIERKPSAAKVNSTTDTILRVEHKGMTAFDAHRRGNVMFFGAGPPVLETAQGAPTRFRWVFNENVPAMPDGMRHNMHSEVGLAWIATMVINHAIEVFYHDDTETPDTLAAAADILSQTEEDILVALRDLYEPGEDSDWMCHRSIKDKLRAAGVDELNNHRYSWAIRSAFPHSIPKQKRCYRSDCCAGANSVKGQQRIKERPDPDAPQEPDAPQDTDAPPA